MKWKILNQSKTEDPIKILLENRGLKTDKEKTEFLDPVKPEKFTAKDLGIDGNELKKATIRIEKAVENGEEIIVYGDYDADGICATAILWEALYQRTKKVLPYIPERVGEGYGLNNEAIKNLKLKNKNLGLIITVDHGIVAHDEIAFAKELGIDVIVCDHHQRENEVPQCEAVVHTDKICAAAIAWYLAGEVQKDRGAKVQSEDLVAIATIADLEPLIGINRSFVKYGLVILNQTKRKGLLAIFEEASLKKGEIDTYEVGYIIAPRLNAAGRMEHALASLRLICTPNETQAKELASRLGLTNRERQVLTEETTKHAIHNLKFPYRASKVESSKLIIVGDETYNQGIIGLVAGRLVEEFYRPAIVLSLGEVYSKASARSISSFNIIEAIRTQSDLLVSAGGHPMAAGFTIETAKLALFKEKLMMVAEELIQPEMLQKSLRVDLSLPLSSLTFSLWEKIQTLAPFGLANPEPVFVAEAEVHDFRAVGRDNKHLKLKLSERGKIFSAIAFNQGARINDLQTGNKIKVAFSLTLNEWNGNKNLELKIKDFQPLIHSPSKKV